MGNLVINGNMDFWRRGDSFTASSLWYCDRWGMGLGGSAIVTKEAFVSGGEHPGGSTYVMRVAGTGSSTNLATGVPIPYADTEKVRMQSLTLSGYIRFSASSWTVDPTDVRVKLGYTTGTPNRYFGVTDFADADAVEQVFVQGALPTAWKKFVVNLHVHNATNVVAIIQANTASYDAGDWYEVSQVQLETGSYATPYEYSAGSYDDEAAATGIPDDTRPLGFTDDPSVTATTSRNSDTTILDTDFQRIWYFSTGATKKTVNLPNAATNNMKIIEIIKKDADIGYIEVVSPSTIQGEDVMDGNKVHVVAQHEGVIVQSDSVQWIVKGLINVEDAVGTIVPFGGATAPSGYLLCDSSSYDNTGKYRRLFEKLQYNHGGSGANFNVPDTRHKFIRGVGTGRPVGTAEGYATARPGTPFTGTGGTSGGGHEHAYTDKYARPNSDGGDDRINTTDNTDDPYYFVEDSDAGVSTSGGGGHSHGVGISVDGGGDSETRPENVAANYIIKY